MSYLAKAQSNSGRVTEIRVAAEDYTKAYLMVAYMLPLTSIIIELREEKR